MKKRFVKVLAMALAISLCVLPSRAVSRNSANQLMIRVGLASTSSHNSLGTMEAAHLQNSTGSGYRFGYYDSNLNFVELARTDKTVTQVAVLKTQNMWYGYVSSQKKDTYSASITSGTAVGCYHVQLNTSFTSYKTAAQRAKMYGDDGFVAYINGAFRVRVGSFTTKEQAQNAVKLVGSAAVVGTSSSGMSVVKTGTNQILFQYDNGTKPLAVQPDVSGSSDPQTWFSGYKYRGGFNYQRIGGGNVTVVNVLPLEDYIRGVVCYEMGATWPLEALKAQAICARTYALQRQNYHNDLGFDICNSSSCQVYRGLGTGSGNGPSSISDNAVAKTNNAVALYNNKPVTVAYASSNGGASESANYIWGTNITNYPYLRGVIDPYEKTVASVNPYSSWSVDYTSASLLSRMQNYGHGKGTTLKNMELTYSELGNVIKVKANFANGTNATFTPRTSPTINTLFQTKSIRFTINGVSASTSVGGGEKTVTVSGSSYSIKGAGFGHQIGMSQYGAYAMAKAGFTGEKIVEFYFPGVRVGSYN